MRADVVKRVENRMHGADEVELDDGVPVDALLAKCGRRVKPLEFYGRHISA